MPRLFAHFFRLFLFSKNEEKITYTHRHTHIMRTTPNAQRARLLPNMSDLRQLNSCIYFHYYFFLEENIKKNAFLTCHIATCHTAQNEHKKHRN